MFTFRGTSFFAHTVRSLNQQLPKLNVCKNLYSNNEHPRLHSPTVRGRDRLSFLKKDMYNKFSSYRRAIGNKTDSQGVLGYLTCFVIRDGNFFCRFNVNEDDCLNNLFWVDGTCRIGFQTFGDVLAFDTTYRTNAYNKPLLIFVGVNHHFCTVVF